jgi:hypothetical protein
MPKKIYSFEISKSLYNKSFTLQFTLSIYAKREKMARLRRFKGWRPFEWLCRFCACGVSEASPFQVSKFECLRRF